MAGFQVVKYDKGDDYIWYNRNFEWFSHTRNVDLTNKELCDLINYSIEKLNYNPKVSIEEGIPLFIKWFKKYERLN